VDGQVVLTFDPTGKMGDLTNPGPLRIGNHMDSGYNSFFKGLIDEVSLYNRALSTNEIAAIYAAGSAGKCASMPGSITAYIVPSGTIGNQTLPVSQTQSMGNDFDVVSPITISSLGVFDSGGDGLVGTLIARIYNRDTQVSVASLIFTSSDPGMLAGGSRFKNLPSPITLPTGFHGVCSVAYLGTTSLEPDGNLRAGSGNWTTNNGGGLLSFVGMGRHSLMGTGDAFPNIVESAPAPNNFAAGTFNYSAAAGTAPSIVVAPQSQTNNIGDNIAFTVTANGTMPFSYQWSRNTINIPGATNATLLLNNIQIGDAGNYSVVVSNSYGSVTSSNAALTIMIPDCTTPPSGLVGWWRVNGNVEDSVNTNRGILGGGVFFGTGKVAGGLVCATNATGVRIPANAALNVGLGNGLTIECWINPIDLKLGPIVEWNNGAGAMGVHFWKGEFAGPGTLYANLVDTSGNNHVMQSVDGVVQSNVWQHVALSYDHATGIACMYCNGVLVKQQNIGVLSLRTSYDFYLGNRPEPTADATSFVGGLDEVSLYNRALSTNEIAAIYAAGSSGKCLPATPVVISGPITNSANGHSYFLLGGSSWTEAEAKAVALGGHLVTINDASENAWVLSIFGAGGTRALWIGLNDAASEGAFTWISGDAAAYRNWSSGEPNNYGGNENYAYIGYPTFADGTWNDQPDSGYNPVSGADNRPYMFGVVEIAPAQPSLLPAGAVSWWKAETNALDSVGTNHGVWLGAPRYGAGEVGQAFNFNGTSYVQVPDAPSLHFSNAMTVEAWVNLRTFSGVNSREIVSKIGGPNSDPGSYTFSIDPLSQKAYFIVSDGSSYAVVYSSSTILTNQWTHLAGTYDGSMVKIYVNGQFAGSTPWTQGIFAENHNPLVIGCTLQNPNPTSFFNGLIDELSLYNRALSTNEIAAIYAAGSTGKYTPSQPNCTSSPSGIVSWWPGEGTGNDIAGVNNGTWAGFGSLNAYAAGIVGTSFVFDGTHRDRVDIGNPANLQLQNFTIEAWIKRSSATVVSLDDNFADGSIAGNGAYIFGYGVGGYGLFLLDAGEVGLTKNSYGDIHVSPAVTDTNWHHVAVTKSGSNVVFYVDGTLLPAPSPYSDTFQFTTSAAIGSRGDGGGNTFYGNIDELSIYNRGLSSTEIQAIYAAGSAGKCFTPALPVITRQPTNQTITVGLPVAFSVVASGSAPISYQWQFNGNPIAGATNSNYAITAVQTNHAGAYRVVVANPFGTTNSAPATLTILPLPMVPVITSVSPLSAKAGETVQLTGTNFSPVAASNIVYFGAVRAAVGFASPTNLQLNLPVGATFAPPTVTVGGLTGTAKNSFTPTFAGSGLISAANFAPRFNLTSGNGPVGTIIADLDGDGKPDMAIADGNSHTISIYRNISTNGTLTPGSFGPRVVLPGVVGTTTPYLIVAADVDGDGRLDLVTTEVSANLVSVFRNLATPGSLSSNSFAPRVSFSVGSGPRALAVADLDGDGRPEIVSANYGSSTVSILRNVSSPGQISSNSFAPRLDLPTGSGTHGLALADLDGDGKPDIATANAAANTISLLRNLATPGSLTSASFAPAVVLAGPTYPHFLRAADLDGDGKLELILTSYMGQSVSVYLNRATPGTLTPLSFAPRVEFALGARGHTISIGDLNGDSKPDVVVDCEIPDRVCVFQNLGVPGSFTSGSFAARVDLPGGYNVWGSSVGDLDGDSRPDILVANSYDNNISIYRNLGSLPPTITQQPTTQSVVLGDWVMFNVLATGTSPFSYQWRFNGDAIAGATNNSLVLPEAQLSQAGDYSVTVANAAGSVLSSNATLTVNVPVCTEPPTGLVSWWPGEASALDTASTNHGTLQAGINFATGKVGQGFVFNKTNSAVVIPASPNLNIGAGNGFTLEAWINPTDVAQTHALFEWNDSTWWGVHFFIAPGQPTYGSSGPAGPGQLYANIVDSAGGWHQLGSPGGVVASNVFQHVALTYDKASGVAKIYRNGQIVSQTTLGSFTPLTTYNLYLGRRQAPSNEAGSFAGLMDEPSIYNRALSQAEIAAIYAARGAGKCPLPPTVLSVTPTNWYVNEGSSVSYTVTAVGSPVLTYQWQHNGSDIVNATNATLTLSNVVYAQAGNYDVVVSNPAGMITSTNVLLRVNRAPIADASATDTLAISPNGTNAVVVLDGSRSSDPDGDALTYAWFNFGDTNAFATSIVAMESLPVGTNQVILTVNDGMAWNSQSIAIEVITTSQALDRLIALVQSGSGNTQPLVASLRAALAAIDRSQPAVAINQLEAFINKVHVQLEPSDPVLAAQLIADAQAIIDALNGGTSVAVASVEITSLTPDHHGKAHLKIKGIKGRVHVIETSTNMVDWTPVGVATQSSDDTFEFDDQGAQDAGARFYRVISPK